MESEVKLGLALGVGRRAVPFVDGPPRWNGAKSSSLKCEERSVMVDARGDPPRYGDVTIKTRSMLKGIGLPKGGVRLVPGVPARGEVTAHRKMS